MRMLSTGSFFHQAEVCKVYLSDELVVVSQLHVMSEGFLGIDTSQVSREEREV